MKLKELRQQSTAELEKLLKDSREKTRQARFDLASGKLKNVKLIRDLKKEAARVITLMEENLDKKP